MTALGVEARLAAGEYQRDQIRLAGQYAAHAAELSRLWRAGKMTDDQYMRLYIALERAGHDTSAKAAARFLGEFRELNGVDAGAVVASEFDEAAALARTIALVRSVEADPDAAETVIGRYAVGLNRAVLNAGRDTVAASAAAAHRTWRRVTDANPCAFCAMLATRDDYSSKDAALHVGGGSSCRKRHKRPLGSQYHDHCGCTAVEVLGEWEPTDDDLAHQDLYDKAQEALADEGSSPTAGNVLKKMRSLGEGVVHDSHVSDSKRKKPGPKPKETSRANSRTSETKPKTATGGSGGGGRKPPTARAAGDDYGDFEDWKRHSLDGASADELEALRRWTTSEHKIIQEQLRAGKLDDQIAKVVQRIDVALARNPLPVDVKLHRRDTLAAFQATTFDEVISQVGRIVDLPAYVALSTRPGGVKTSPDAVVRVHITVPRGTPAAYIEQVSEKPKQRETLVIHGKLMAITDAKMVDGVLHVWCDMA